MSGRPAQDEPGREARDTGRPQRILVTGATGFVGTYLRARLSQGPALTIPWPSSAEGPVDLRDAVATDAAVAAARPDVIVHLAAQSSVGRAGRDAGDTFAINLGGSLNLALAMVRHAPDATLLFASSSEVYGASFLDGPVTEASPPRPMNAYARSKRLAEDMFAAVLPPSAGLIVARPFNHTGPGQGEDFVLPAFAGQVARIERGLQPTRLTVGNIDVRRDFLHVRDVVDAYLALIDAAPRLPRRFTCNIASGQAVPLHRHVETLRELSSTGFEVIVDPARLRPVDVPVAVGDAALLRRLTGWSPLRSMRETLRDLLAAAREGHAPHSPRPVAPGAPLLPTRQAGSR